MGRFGAKTERVVRERGDAEPYDQPYVAASPNRDCGLGAAGLPCPVGVATVE